MDQFQEALRRELEDCRLSGELVAFHKWSDRPSIFLVGFVDSLGEDDVVFRKVNSCGEDDGPREDRYKSIIKIHRGSDYLKGLLKLHKVHSEIYKDAVPSELAYCSRKMAGEVLARAASNEEVVTVFERKGKLYGIPREVSSGRCVIEVIVEGGQPDGLFTIDLRIIRKVRARSKHEFAQKYLFDHRH